MIAARSTETRHADLRPADANLAHFPAIEATEFRDALRNLASGVAIVATGVGEARRGLTASSVTSICADPPCLLVSVNTKSEAHDSILANGYLASACSEPDRRRWRSISQASMASMVRTGSGMRRGVRA
jgi:flavin reductase (DIM6/NTAB) family NADH-FMN oxidoreductase RutF